MLRDIVGLTGLRAAAALGVLYAQDDPHASQLGYSYRRNASAPASGVRFAVRSLVWRIRRVLVVQTMMFAALWTVGHPLAYLLWPASWLTTYMLFSRIRNAAEHGGLPGTMTTDIWRNTRSVRAAWWERVTVAPNHVNWHFEHHLAPTIPGYRLAALNRLLSSAQLPAPLPVRSGYVAVVRELVSWRESHSAVTGER